MTIKWLVQNMGVHTNHSDLTEHSLKSMGYGGVCSVISSNATSGR